MLTTQQYERLLRLIIGIQRDLKQLEDKIIKEYEQSILDTTHKTGFNHPALN